MKWKIPVAKPSIGPEEIAAVIEVMKSGWISQGKMVNLFEKKFSDFCNTKFGIATNSGTSALMLALRSLNVGYGDEVITTCLTCTATINAIVLVGAIPVLVDIDDNTLNIDPNLIEKKINRKTKAIIPVHLFGYPADMDSILNIASKYDIPVIEDACLALGSMYKGKKCGAIGTLGCFSFYTNKHITTGEGGMVVTNSEILYNKIKGLANLGKSPIGKHQHNFIGYNFKMTDIQAAIGLTQLKKINNFILRRRKIVNKLRHAARVVKGIISYPHEGQDVFNSYFAFYFIMESKKERDKFDIYLNMHGIETRPLMSFIPLQDAFKHFHFPLNELTRGKKLYERGLYITCSPTLKEEEIHYLITKIQNFKQ